MIKQVTFADVKIGQEFKACWNANNPIYFDTFPAIKINNSQAEAIPQFKVLELHPEEPVFIKVN